VALRARARGPSVCARLAAAAHARAAAAAPQLEMEDGDSIDAMMEQVGGC
jgi:hypothetical protein